jgi:hypothetical protein
LSIIAVGRNARASVVLRDAAVNPTLAFDYLKTLLSPQTISIQELGRGNM